MSLSLLSPVSSVVLSRRLCRSSVSPPAVSEDKGFEASPCFQVMPFPSVLSQYCHLESPVSEVSFVRPAQVESEYARQRLEAVARLFQPEVSGEPELEREVAACEERARLVGLLHEQDSTGESDEESESEFSPSPSVASTSSVSPSTSSVFLSFSFLIFFFSFLFSFFFAALAFVSVLLFVCEFFSSLFSLLVRFFVFLLLRFAFSLLVHLVSLLLALCACSLLR